MRNKKIVFSKDRLPNTETYFENQGLKLRGYGEWRSTICPFHDDTNPSLRIHMDHGGFICMACDARGGDIIEFHRKLHGLSFIEAIKSLGASEYS